MEFISEEVIEQVIQKYEETTNFETDLMVIRQENPLVFEFISEDRIDLLKKEELALLEFMVVVIYHSVKTALKKTPKIQGKHLEEAEESNYEIWENLVKKSPQNVFDKYFEAYAQEDLLAFVEDSLVPDDENPITGVGTEIIAVTAKSLIDALHAGN